jgi:hypothetical protein
MGKDVIIHLLANVWVEGDEALASMLGYIMLMFLCVKTH